MNREQITSKCYHCGETENYPADALIGAWVVCRACERPHRWNAKPGTGRWRTAMTLCLAVWAGSLAAQQPAGSPRALTVTAENLMAGDAAHQELAAGGGDAAALLPGDVVHYRLRFTNVTDGEVRGVVFTNPVPQGLHYIAGSAGTDRGDVAMDFSIDGGRTYSARPMLVAVVDGERVERPAPPERYSHVRWTVRGAISQGAMVTAEFRAMLPAAASDSSSHNESTHR